MRKKRNSCLNADGLPTCPKCGEVKETVKQGYCNKCHAEYEKMRRASKGIKTKVFSYTTENEKFCTKCLSLKPKTQFYKSSSTSDGLSTACKECLTLYADAEKARISTARYRAKNPEKYKAQHRIHQYNRKAKVKATDDGTVTEELLKILYSDTICPYCLSYVEEDERTIEHVVPLSGGGLHSDSNLVMCCNGCNSSKRQDSMLNFIRKRNASKNHS